MDSMLNRYRNTSVLVLVILAQLLLLAYQVKGDQDVRLIRMWAVTAVTPLARAIEAFRSGIASFLNNYVLLRDVRERNQRLQSELNRVKLENQFLHSELSTADRARALSAFQARTQSRTLAARAIGSGAGSNSKMVFVDRGSSAGVQKGMAVITADGIVGKVIGAFPTASQVLLVTDPNFAAGVISQKNRVRGTLKGTGYDTCRVDFIPSEVKLESGEWFYTSGDDRVFPKGLPVGIVKAVRPGSPFKEVLLDPSGMQGGLEEVLIVLAGVHQQIPDMQASNPSIHLMPEAESPAPVTPPVPGAGPITDADRLRQRYKALGEAQGHKFGEGGPGAKPPDFNLKLNQEATPQPSVDGRQ